MHGDFLDVQLVFSYFLYIGSYPRVVAKIYYHSVQIFTQSNSQGLQNSLGQNVFTLVSFTYLCVDFLDV